MKSSRLREMACTVTTGGTSVETSPEEAEPLLSWLDEGVDAEGFSAADRVVGKATAYLYCLLGVTEVYAHVMSVPAAKVLQDAGIRASFGQLVEGIQNRQKNGPCPMEHATRSCTTPAEALTAIRLTLQKLR